MALSDAAQLAIVDCPSGKCLSAARYRAGRGGARHVYATRLEKTSGRLRGWYCTGGLYPRQAAIAIQFYNGGERLGSRTIGLDAAPQGAHFEAR